MADDADADAQTPMVQEGQPATRRATVTNEAIVEEVRDVVEQVMFHQGPLPPAELLRQYDLAVPGLAREIADGAKEERQFRHRMTERTGTQEFVLNLAGLGAMLLALLMMLGIVAYMVSLGHAAAGAALGGAIIVGVIVALSNYRKSEVTSVPPPTPERGDQ